MAQLYEYVKMAIDNIRANKGRSFLTMLGIIIGISSVIMIMSVGGGAKTEMSDALSAIAEASFISPSTTAATEARSTSRREIWRPSRRRCPMSRESPLRTA